ncbi:hypothetical protein [Rhizobium leguminosarum]|uniref:hypothetical protein n=1 Tax=Rhizobium leguminosarum TaxID=384 RepID=UPI002FF0B262
MAKRPKSSKTVVVKKPQPGSLGEALEEVGYRPFGRRIIVGRSGKVTMPPPPWIEPVIDFVSSALPRDPDGNWEHLCISALELGCELLVRLGHAAHMMGYGAKPVAEARSSDLSLRWDDVATVVISLAAQTSFLGFRVFAGTSGGPARLLRPNIRAAHGCGPGYLDPGAFAVFRSLGLIDGGSWTEAAETVLWRECPEEWAIDFTRDERFLRARDVALATVPRDIAIEIDRASTISEQDIIDWLTIPERHRTGAKTRKDALKALQLWAQIDLDGIFIRRWRLADGWLSADEARHGLTIQLDPLAANMRSAFAAKYLPHLPFLAV